MPVGGRLTLFKRNWTAFPLNDFIRQILEEGHTIPFLGPPPVSQVKYTPLVGTYAKVLKEEIQKLLIKGAIEEVPLHQATPGYFSHYFLVPKKTGDLRPILNLRPLNKRIQVDSFKMETLSNVCVSMSKGEWLASLDLKDAYFHVPIRRSHWKYLRFAMEGKVYQYKVLPFGLSTSPRIFTKVLAPVVAAIRLLGIHIHPYLDDILVRASSPETLLINLQMAMDMFLKAGYIINLEKSHLRPTQDLIFIGGHFRMDLGMIFLPKPRREALIALAKLFKVGQYKSAKLWLGLVGRMVSTFAVVKNARLFIRPIQIYVISQWNSQESLEKKDHSHKTCVRSHQVVEVNPKPKPRFAPMPTRTLSCDHNRCIWVRLGGGGVLNNELTVQGSWERPYQSDCQINSLEMEAVLLTLKHFSQILQGSVVLVRSDNTTTCSYINKKGGTKSVKLCIQVWHLLNWAILHNIELKASFLPGQHNVQADILSRKKVSLTPVLELGHFAIDHREWSLHPEVSNAVFLLLGEPVIDLFASLRNHKLRMFCSIYPCKLAMIQDAFTTSWRNLYSYALSSDGHNQQGPQQDSTGPVHSASHSTQMAEQTLVFQAPGTVNTSTSGASRQVRPVVPRGQFSQQSGNVEAHSMARLRKCYETRKISQRAISTMLAARKPQTWNLYAKLFGVFERWCVQRKLDPSAVDITHVIEFLQWRFDKSKAAVNTLKVYCAALTVCLGKFEGYTVSSHPFVSAWLKGAYNIKPPVHPAVPRWSLPLVLHSFMEAPYEPMEKASLSVWTRKTIFLVAISSGARCSELQALDVREEMSVIRNRSASLRTNPGFTPKHASEVNINRKIHLKAFYHNFKNRVERNWNTLCPIRALKHYIALTKRVRGDCFYLFMPYAPGKSGKQVSTVRIGGWLIQAIKDAYIHFGRKPPEGLKPHTLRAVATSAAALRGSTIEDIRRAATWASGYVFAKHYKLDMVPQDVGCISTKVLKTVTKPLN